MQSRKLTTSSDASLAEILNEVIPVSLYRHVVDRLENGGPWEPVSVMAKPADLSGQDPEDLDQLLRMTNSTPAEKTLREAYNLWLNRVTWAESENANRLETLIWAVRESEKAQDTVAEHRLRSFISRHFGLDELPLTALAARGLSQKHTRNYRAMDRDWRRAGWGLDEAYFASKPLVKAPAPKKPPTTDFDDDFGW